MGGVLQGFWLLWQFVNCGVLRKTWFIYTISLPLMGALLSSLTYLIFFSGFMAVVGKTETDPEFFISATLLVSRIQFPMGN
jgi:hypothetical protein